MPTAYTSKIYNDEELSLKDFILLCARQFGACITMRDEPLSTPIPEQFEPSDYHVKQIERIEKELQKLNDNPRTDEEWGELYQKAYDKAFLEHQETEKYIAALKLRYENMIEKVSNWVPPTKDHANLKDFALKQLEDSMRHDTMFHPFEFTRKEKWIDIQSSGQYLRENLAYHKAAHEKEIQTCEKRNLWIKQLRDSLK